MSPDPPSRFEATANSDDSAPGRPFIWLRRIAPFLGIALILSALFVVLRRGDVITDALAALARPHPIYLALLLAAVITNIILTGLMFSILMSRFGRVGLIEMQAVIASATLINFLPLRPGLFGRIAYHKAANDIHPVHSARVIIESAIISAAVVGYIAATLLLSTTSQFSLIAGLVAPIPILALLAAARSLRIHASATLTRYLELVVWAVRYYTAFRLIGSPIDASGALAFACISVIATMIPLVSNGLGLREWAIGLAAPLLTAYELPLAITAELVNRAAELIVIAILGLIAIAYLAHLRRRRPQCAE